MSISQKYSSSYPSLYLNFAQSGQLDPRISLSRASTGTYVNAEGILKTAEINEARFDYENGECKGLLVENSRTNQFRNSENLSSAQWTATNATVSVSGDISLRNTGVYQITSTGSSPRIYNSTRIGGCYSYYVKKIDNSLVSITISPSTEGGWGHIFNFDTGEFTYVNGGHRQWTANKIYIGNGWWRLWGYTAETVIYGDELGVGPGDFRPSAGTQTGSILVTAPQNESGSFITSYIPNTSTSSGATSAADKVTINDLSWFDDYEGTFIVDTNLTGVTTTTTLFSVDNGGSQIIFNNSKVNIGTGKTLYSIISDKSALGYSSSKNIVVTSTSSAFSTVTSSPTGLNRLALGWDPLNSNNYLNGPLKSFRYYPSLLDDNQIISITKTNQSPLSLDFTPGQIITSNLVLHLDAGISTSYSGSGNTWYNIGTNGGSISQGTYMPSYTTLGGALCFYFDRVGAYFQNDSFFTSQFPSDQTNLTIDVWFYPSPTELSSGDRGNLIRAVNGNGFYMSWNKYTQKQSNYWYGKTNEGYHESGADITRGTWNNVVAVWNSVNLSQYLNGTKTTANTSGTSADKVSGIQIGWEGNNRQFSGGIAIIRMYDIALNDSQVEQNFSATKSRFGI